MPLHNNYTLKCTDPPTHCPASEQALFQRIQSSPTARKLWRYYAATSNCHSWYDLNTNGQGADLKLFWRECNGLHIQLHARNTLHSSYTLTGGWEDFLYTDLQVRWCIGVTPLTAIPGTTFLPTTPVCNAFTCSGWAADDLLQHVQHHGQAIFWRPGTHTH